MFQVICIATDEVVDVYAVSGVRFLVWNADDTESHWEWVPMEQFRPVTTDDMAQQGEWE